jgi:hypothetical protein
MFFEIIGFVFVAIYIILVIWGGGKIVVSAWQGRKWTPTQAAAVFASAAIASGIVLFVKNALPFDTVGIGAILAGFGGIVLWAAGKDAD